MTVRRCIKKQSSYLSTTGLLCYLKILHLCNMDTAVKSNKFYAFHSEALILELDAFTSKNKSALKQLRENKYRASDLPVSRRVLSHWRTLKVFDVYGDNPEQMQISFVALFWLQVVSELRMFGLSLEKIELIKKQLFSKKKSPIVELYIYFAWNRKSLDVFMLISPEGEVVLGSKNEIEAAEAFGLIEKNYIKLNFHILLNRIVKRKIEIIQQPIQSFLSDEEFSVLEAIRNGEYKQIILKFSNGSITQITKKALEKQNPDPVEEIRKIMASNQDLFCTITLQRTNGKFVSISKDITEKT